MTCRAPSVGGLMYSSTTLKLHTTKRKREVDDVRYVDGLLTDDRFEAIPWDTMVPNANNAMVR